MGSKTKKVMISGSIVALGLAAPLAFSSGSVIVPNNACGQNNPDPAFPCCYQINSICSAGGTDVRDYYTASGPC